MNPRSTQHTYMTDTFHTDGYTQVPTDERTSSAPQVTNNFNPSESSAPWPAPNYPAPGFNQSWNSQSWTGSDVFVTSSGGLTAAEGYDSGTDSETASSCGDGYDLSDLAHLPEEQEQ